MVCVPTGRALGLPCQLPVGRIDLLWWELSCSANGIGVEGSRKELQERKLGHYEDLWSMSA